MFYELENFCKGFIFIVMFFIWEIWLGINWCSPCSGLPFLYRSPITGSKKEGLWLSQPSCSWLFYLLEKTGEHLRASLITWLLLFPSFDVVLRIWWEAVAATLPAMRKRPEPHRMVDPVLCMDYLWNNLHVDFSLCLITKCLCYFNKFNSIVFIEHL